MKKTYFITIFLLIFILISGDNNSGVIGVVSYLEGELADKFDSNSGQLKKGSLIYQNSEIISKNGKNSKIELLTLSGLYQISKFPAKDFKNFSILDKESQSIFYEAIAVSLFAPRNIKSTAYAIGWDMNIDTILENDIKNNGLKLILSPDENSLIKKSYIPLIFKLNNSLKIKSIAYEIIDINENIIKKGEFLRDNNRYIFDFNSFNYNKSITYTLKIYTKTDNNKIMENGYNFKIIGNEDFNAIQKEINDQSINIKNEFLKSMNAAKIYQRYKLIITKNNFLIKLGMSL